MFLRSATRPGYGGSYDAALWSGLTVSEVYRVVTTSQRDRDNAPESLAIERGIIQTVRGRRRARTSSTTPVIFEPVSNP